MPARWQAIAGDRGVDDLMVTRGYSRVLVDQCLSDEKAARAIVDQSTSGSDAYGVNSTPSFALNGKTLDGVHTWDQLQAAVNPQIK
jgi:protein-disulfide isomerase